jgi:predicted O-linked N-acetylglucosamine transferase (SPINDLY family)
LSYQNNKNFNKLLDLLKSSQFVLAKELILEDKKKYNSDPIFYNLVGFIYDQLGDFSRAEKNYLRSIKIDKSYHESKFNLGILYYKSKDLDKAKNIFLELLKEDNQDFKYYFNISIICCDQSTYEEATKYLKVCCFINPKSYEAHHQLGLAYEKIRNFTEAIKYYEIANKLNFNQLAITLNNLGNVYLDLKKYEKAIECFEKALELNGDKSLIYSNIGIAYNEIGDVKKVLYFWKQGLLLNKKNLILRQRYLFNLLYTFEGISSYKEEAIEYRNNITNFNIIKKNISKNNNLEKELNVGFVSGDFKEHPVSFFLMDILGILKNKNIKLFGYSSLKVEDKYTEILKKKFNSFFNVHSFSDVELCNKILEDKIDILIDMSGYTHKTRLQIFAQRISPIQITWAGWLASSGIKEMDYIIGDPWVTPEEYKYFYVEKILQLPKIWCHLSTSDIKNLTTSDTPSLKNNYITFGSFNHLHKINNDVIKVWSKILLLIPNSVLVLKNFQISNSIYKKRIVEEFKKNKINEDRLFLEVNSKRENFLLSYNNIDIALDAFPYSGGTTSFETAWMCVPLLTLAGEAFISRCGVSINKNLKQDDWIAKNVDDYINKAVEFSKDIEKLNLTRSYLRENSRKSVLFNSDIFADDLSNALRKVWYNFIKND